eukprot:2356750-Lingulodinium_polyedra.AAC.1
MSLQAKWIFTSQKACTFLERDSTSEAFLFEVEGHFKNDYIEHSSAAGGSTVGVANAYSCTL